MELKKTKLFLKRYANKSSGNTMDGLFYKLDIFLRYYFH